MPKLKVKIKRFRDEARIPSFQSEGAVGADLMAVKVIKNGLFKVWYDCEFAAEIPKGYVGLIFPRSSISNYPLVLANSVGVVDPDYRGTFQVRFNRTFPGMFSRKKYRVGDYVAQMVIMKTNSVDYVDTEIITETKRGRRGYGSTGR